MAYYKQNNDPGASSNDDSDYIVSANGIKYRDIKNNVNEPIEVLQQGDFVKIEPIVYYNGIKIDKKYGALLTPTEFIVPYTPGLQLHELTFLGYPYLHEAIKGMNVGGKRRIIFPAKMAFTKEFHPVIVPDDGAVMVEAVVAKHVVNG